jgi:hypothetical protein
MTYIKKEGPGAVGAATGASKDITSRKRQHTNSRPAGRQELLRVTFVEWCSSDAPHKLNLDTECVAWICRVMGSGAEMHGVNTWGRLEQSLKVKRTPLRWSDAIAWNRLMLTAQCMWCSYQGGRL